MSEKALYMIDNNLKILNSVNFIPEGKEEAHKFYVERYNNAVESLNDASAAIYKNAPFIPEKFYNLFHDMREKCRNRITNYYMFFIYPTSSGGNPNYEGAHNHKCLDKGNEIIDMRDEIVSQLREYLYSLDVLDSENKILES